MGRYARLYANFLRFSFSKAMEFRLDFFFRFGMDCLFYAVHIVFYMIVFSQTETLGGWTYDQALVFLCGFLVVDAAHMTVYATNMWWLPFVINDGQLDYYLVRPVSSMFFLSFREFSVSSLMNLVVASGLFVWSLARYPGGFSAGQLTAYLLLLALGSVLYYFVRICFLVPAFWMQQGQSLNRLFHTVDQLTDKPHRVYQSAFRWVVLTVLPFGFVASVPADALFGDLAWRMLAMFAAVTAFFWAFTVWFWNCGIKNYSSASS